MNKFDLPAFFDREYYESRYLIHKEKGNETLAKVWEGFFFDNALSFEWCRVFEENRYTNPKKADTIATEAKKALEKSFK